MEVAIEIMSNVSSFYQRRGIMDLQPKPARGGFLRPFGCGWFIREYLMGNKPGGSPSIDPDAGAPQADIFYHYKNSLRKAIALDRATGAEEKNAQ